jgi:enoyl-CoA hydratase
VTGRVDVRHDGAVIVVTIDNAEKRNALTASIMRELDGAMAAFEADASAHVAVVTGAGTDAFSAGADLASLLPELHAQGLSAVVPDAEARFFSRVTKPIVAAVEGFCLAGGLEVFLGTDLRIAAESASFGLAEVRWGLVPAGGGVVRLSRQIPWAIAMQLLLTGDVIPATRAYEVGLVNEVVPDGTALTRALELAHRISRNGPFALMTAKRIAQDVQQLETAFRHEFQLAAPVFQSDDAREGPLAFVERRAPQFTGR